MAKGTSIVLIFADQMQRFAIGCMDNMDVKTPVLDGLAREGTLFTNAYSNCPICTPFRVNLLTGLYTSQTGTFKNGDRVPRGIPTIADAFNDSGYQTCFVGKWHVGATGNAPVPEELRAGFKEFDGYQCYNGFYKDVVFHDEHGNSRTFNGQHRTDVTTDLAIERLEAMATRDEPFFLVVAYQAPHYPVQPSPPFLEMYKDLKVTRRGNVQEVDPYTRTHSPPSPKPKESCLDYQAYGDDLDEYIRRYYGMVSQVDANVGRIIEAIERLGLSDSTATIFTADHGDMQGSHGLKNKSLPHEESTGIPLIVSVPGGPRGVVSQALVSGIDLFPTCLELAALPARIGLPGTSLAGTVLGKKQHLSGPVFSEMQDWKMVRYGDFKLVVESPGFEPSMLFDLKNDPLELHDLVNDEAHAITIMDLRAMIESWFKELGTVTWSGVLLKAHEEAGVPVGLIMNTVPSDSVAAILGFKSGDIITGIDGTSTVNAMDFQSAIDGTKDADEFTMTFLRDGKRQEIMM